MLWRKELILQRLDPTSGFPEAPLPLPEPEIEIGIEPGLEIPTGELVPLDTLSASPLDSMALDSMALDSVAAGAAPSDSMNADSTAGATARPDSVPR
jgi:hypothetical protein